MMRGGVGGGVINRARPRDMTKFVLGTFTPNERDVLEGEVLRAASDVLRVYMHRGFQAAANVL